MDNDRVDNELPGPKIFLSNALRWTIFGMGLALLFGAPDKPSAATLEVNLDGSADYTSIQEAILASVNDDSVLVHPGHYRETLFYGGRRITVVSTDGPKQTIIDAEGTRTVVVFQSNEPSATTLDGFTLTGGRGLPLEQPERPAPPTPIGAGEDEIPSRDASASRNRLGEELPDDAGDRRLTFGGGILCIPGNPTLKNLWIIDNTANIGGGAFLLSSTARFYDCVFRDNVSGGGGGVSVETGTPRFEDCRFEDNVSVFGGALQLRRCSASVNRCLFINNTGNRGGAIRITEPGVLSISYSIFVRNRAGSGSAIQSSSATTELSHCLFAHNGVPEFHDPATVQFIDSGSGSLQNNIFFMSRSATHLECSGVPLVLTCNDFWPGPVPEGLCGVGTGNFTDHPLFCKGGDFLLHADSPCLPENSPGDCGAIGPFDQPGCPLPIDIDLWEYPIE